MTELRMINILSPGTKFIILDNPKDGSFPPGTIGFMSHVIDGNIIIDGNITTQTYRMQVFIIRKGKKGKRRVYCCDINSPVFLDDELQVDDNYLASLPLGIKYYVHIQKMPMENSLIDVSTIDFIGWFGAYGQYIRFLTGFSNHGFKWPEEKSDPLNISGNLMHMWDDDETHLIELYSSKDLRVKTINTIRRVEASLIRCLPAYQQQLRMTILRAASTIMKISESHKNELIPSKEISNLIKRIDKFGGPEPSLHKLKMTKSWR